MWSEIADYVPKDHRGQVTAEWMLLHMKDALPTPLEVVDLGCGEGNSVDFFRANFPGCHWTGVDIAESPEVHQRKRDDADFLIFDGVNIPRQSNSVDLVFSRQVLEHVRHPEEHLKDALRILKPGGYLIGSTSHLEAYHSFQYWNFTPFGFKEIVTEIGFTLEEIRPGIDGLTLLRRTYEGRPRTLNKFFSEESPINQEIEEWATNTGSSVRQTIVKKLSICGQFTFVCRKPR